MKKKSEERLVDYMENIFISINFIYLLFFTL